MAMIKCPECGKDMSDKATACPNCGCPIEDIKAKINEIESEKEEKERAKAEEKKAKEIAEEIKRKQKEDAKKAVTPEMKKKRVIIAALCAVVIIIAGIFGWYYGINLPQIQAYSSYVAGVDAYNDAVSSYNESINCFNEKAKEIISINQDYENAIKNAQDLVDSGDAPYEGEIVTTLSNTLKDARNNKAKTPELKEIEQSANVDESLKSAPKISIDEALSNLDSKAMELTGKIDSINKETQDLVVPNYDDILKKMETESKELQDSYTIQKQITLPSEEWVITRLGRVENVANIAPVTEEHDPNGHLNKDGGYTSTVYFSSPLLGTEGLKGDALIDKGTDAGGAIEVYKTPEEAENRRKYLAAFDGGIFASGSHVVLGTMLVRTSDDLKASEQETLTNAIIAAMIEID